MSRQLVIGSRGSKLALWQAEQARQRLAGFDVCIEVIKTTGDVKNDPLSVIGGKGVFTKELEDALLDRRIDLAVHSLKDLPSLIPSELMLAAICERENPFDALVLPESSAGIVSLESLRSGAVIGTSSPRRVAQLKHLRPDVVVKEVRGNVDTRIRKLDAGDFDALILACAGLRRLGLENRITGTLFEMLPTIAQGALGLETRANDANTIAAVAKLDHAPTQFACTAERSLLRALGGGCQLPIAGYARLQDEQLMLEGLVADPEGKEVVRVLLSDSTSSAEQLGRAVAEQLKVQGADRLLALY